jgi:hypothetical protein
VGKLWLPPITNAVVYEHPPARVWRALTDPELLAGWLMRPVGFAPVVGTPFEFRADPAPGCDGFNVLIARAVLGLGWRRLLVRQLRRALESLATHP